MKRLFGLLIAFAAVPMFAELPSVRLFENALLPHRLDPGQRGTFSVTAQNRAATPATNLVLTIALQGGGTFESASDPNCTVAQDTVVCTRASLALDEKFNVDVVLTAPLRTTGEDFLLEAKVTSAEGDVDPTDNEFQRHVLMPRQFVVENVEDQGSGSLRQAIHDLNTLCAFNEACEIAFRIPAPVPANGWFTIRPRTPLPEVAGSATIDGKTQTTFTGDTNQGGPEIEIDGALVHEESGLRVRPECAVSVRHLAVNGFPGYGIEVRRPFGGIPNDRCFISSQFQQFVEIAENQLGRNQRGLGIFTLYSRVHDNVIRGNLRSGIYVADLVQHTDIRGNTIESNGAGIFFNVGDPLFGPPAGADVLENVIARNGGMAIARTRKGEILIRQNSMFDNLLQGIDIDVDAKTPNRELDVDAPNHPLLLSARYDPVQDATIVRGRLDSNAVHGLFTASYMIDVYASSRLSVWGYPQAESFLQEVRLFHGHEDFEIVVPGDQRGRWITATSTAFHFVGFARSPRTQSHASSLPGDTSELSNAVMVE